MKLYEPNKKTKITKRIKQYKLLFNENLIELKGGLSVACNTILFDLMSIRNWTHPR